MDAVSLQNEIKRYLVEAGEKLSMHNFSSTQELLDHLDQSENLLSAVGQDPTECMKGALVPLKEALIAKELLNHTEVEVKVSVASCLGEITRITAPDEPYSDLIMKENFQLNAMAFEKLGEFSGRCYTKACRILDSAAKTRSCLLMQDLECEVLILKMFQTFLETVGTGHPKAVLLNMRSIMTMLIKESEDPVELLCLLISSIKKEIQSVSPISFKLAEEVLKNCAETLETYLPLVKKSQRLDSDQYTKVMGLINEHVPGKELENEVHINLVEDETKDRDEEVPTRRVRRPNSLLKPVWGYDGSMGKDQVPCQEDKKKRVSKGPKSAASKELDSKEKSKGHKSSKADLLVCSAKNEFIAKNTLDPTCAPSNAEQGYVIHSDSEGAAGPVPQVIDKYRDLTTSKKHAAEGSLDKSEGCINRNDYDSQDGTYIKDIGLYTDRSLEHCNQAMEKKRFEMRKGDEEIPDKRVRKPNSLLTPEWGYDGSWLEENDQLTCQKDEVGKDIGFQRVSAKCGTAPKNSTELTGVPSNVAEEAEQVILADSLGNPEPSSQQANDKKRKRGRPPKKHVSGGSDGKDSQKASNVKQYGEELVGCRIKVWWPMDRTFYEGYVSSFDPSKKRHKVLYDDGEEETLNLSTQRWEKITDFSHEPVQDADLRKPALLTDDGGSSFVSRSGSESKDIITEKSADRAEPRDEESTALLKHENVSLTAEKGHVVVQEELNTNADLEN